MTPTEQAAYARGVKEARQMAMVAAVTIEARDDHREVRQQAASAALHGLAEGLKELLPAKAAPVMSSFVAIAENQTPVPGCT